MITDSESFEIVSKAFRELVSTKWLEDRILDWISAKYAGEAVTALSKYLVKRREEDVQEHQLWFPVSQLSVESDLTFGNVVFKTITKEIMEQMVEDMQGAKEDRDAAYAARLDMDLTR